MILSVLFDCDVADPDVLSVPKAHFESATHLIEWEEGDIVIRSKSPDNRAQTRAPWTRVKYLRERRAPPPPEVPTRPEGRKKP